MLETEAKIQQVYSCRGFCACVCVCVYLESVGLSGKQINRGLFSQTLAL